MTQAATFLTLNPGDEVTVRAAPTPVVVDTSQVPIIAVINESQFITDPEVDAITEALQAQVDQHLSLPPPLGWGLRAKLIRATRATAPADSWWGSFLNDSDQAGALGYHDLTPAGLPLFKVFVATDKKYGLLPSVTASHEVLEMVVNPYLADAVFFQSGAYSYWIAREVGDPVEADNMGYQIRGQQVSDFILPAWLQNGLPGPFDFMRRTTRALQLTRGGYVSYMPVANPQWKQATAQIHTQPVADVLDPHPEAFHIGARILQEFPHVEPHQGTRRERLIRSLTEPLRRSL